MVNKKTAREGSRDVLSPVLTEKQKKEIEAAVKKAVREYGRTFKLLGKE